MVVKLDASTVHQIALLAQERAGTYRTDLVDCVTIYDRLQVQSAIDALDDFAENLWLRMNDIEETVPE